MSADLQPTTHVTEKDVFERLERLERSVYVPIVSGEVAQWLTAVTTAARDAADTSCEFLRTVHPEIYGQIVEQDSEQSTRVQKLEQEDEEICACLRALVDLADKLRGAGEGVELDERLIANATKELSDRAVAAVQRVRKHETHISTWHVEAMLRDRGAVD